MTENDVVATALTGGVLKNYRCYVLALSEYQKITESDVVATALTGGAGLEGKQDHVHQSLRGQHIPT